VKGCWRFEKLSRPDVKGCWRIGVEPPARCEGMLEDRHGLELPDVKGCWRPGRAYLARCEGMLEVAIYLVCQM